MGRLEVSGMLGRRRKYRARANDGKRARRQRVIIGHSASHPASSMVYPMPGQGQASDREKRGEERRRTAICLAQQLNAARRIDCPSTRGKGEPLTMSVLSTVPRCSGLSIGHMLGGEGVEVGRRSVVGGSWLVVEKERKGEQQRRMGEIRGPLIPACESSQGKQALACPRHLRRGERGARTA